MYVDVGDVGHVAQHVATRGQHGRRHQLERRVLRPTDGHLTPERATATNQEAGHDDQYGGPDGARIHR